MANKNRRSAFTKALSFVDLSKIPGPRGIDYFHYVQFFQRDILGAFTKVNRDYGDIGSFPWPMNSIIIYSPEFARRVLVENHKSYIKGEQIEELRAVVGNGLATNNDYESWLRIRTIIAKEFNAKAIQSFNKNFERLCLEHISGWSGKSEMDVCEEMKFLTFKIACDTLLGVSLSKEDAHKVNEAVHFTSLVTYERIFQFFPVPYWVPTKKNEAFHRHYKNLSTIVNKLILQEKGRQNSHPSSVLERLVHAVDPETKDRLSDDELHDEILTMLLAGHETSAHSLTWTIGLLAKHQEIQEKLHKLISENSLENIPYLQWIIMESMRLYPSFPVLSRKTAETDTLGPYTIPKNTNVVIPIYVIQRNQENFADALTFNPERFASAETQKSFAYLPFSKGPRKCIAEAFAMSEMAIILYQLIKHFSFELIHTDLPQEVASVSLKPVGGMNVRAIKRK
ncbi:cytochrome P450 [Peredibacter starrii]|uniref:Cytochrome P450 n=1 Tax=Peredibacter starrii TaxID=28202 RepID=A0AAX4HKU0_9BACT|nr:cytochrome P450 [Peredibacter starrii]WPU63883.1 cytochrome P450 [Peredibacter starrii]